VGVIQVVVMFQGVVVEQAMLGAFLVHLRHSILKLGGFAQARCRGSLGCVRLLPCTLDSLTDLGYLWVIRRSKSRSGRAPLA
jgi:hypothetical protein